jgi:hypothetical protein
MNLLNAMNTRALPQSSFRNRQAEFTAAFTRLDLLALLGAFFLLMLVVLPALAHDRARSNRIHCANNLRQLWVALQLWGGDHGDQLLWNASMTDGGTRLHPLSANAWLHYSYLSNELNSSKIVLCPSDTGTPASDFSQSATGGYIHPNFRNRATSYFLNAHPSGLVLSTPFGSGNAPLLGDRNIPTDGVSGCSVFASASNIRLHPIRADYGWQAGLHGSNAGNLLLYDGQVEYCEDAKLRIDMEAFDVNFTGGGAVGADVCIPR